MGIEETPVDPMSGLPLLLAPDERVLPILYKEVPNMGPLADWNHVYHPARVVIGGGFGGDALRNARVQFVMRREQHDEYHAHFAGPPLPTKPRERFRAVVLSAAGYIPLQAISLAGESPREVTLSPAVRKRLHTTGEVRVASSSVVQKFLREYVLAQPVDHIHQGTIDRFLELNPLIPHEAREQRYLAHLLLSLVIDRVEDPLEQPYSFARSYDLLAPDMPARPGDFVRSMILRSSKNVSGIVRELTRKFVEYREGGIAIA